MLYESFDRETERGAVDPKTAQLDFLRHVFYMGYRFDDRWLFNAKLDIEHADEISVEFACLDYRVNDRLAVRSGLVLVPLGLVNEFHEPNVPRRTTAAVRCVRL